MAEGGATGNVCTAAGGAAGREADGGVVDEGVGAVVAGRAEEGVHGGSGTEVQAASSSIGANIPSACEGMRRSGEPI
ncbi:hypothetical protein LP414_28325 [Polaromonas sp. P1(28)-13]|nr:hypothetical protein LP414_28325 [Polaromonas sp. P1(28)-13]